MKDVFWIHHKWCGPLGGEWPWDFPEESKNNKTKREYRKIHRRRLRRKLKQDDKKAYLS
jgi:hypothetical protein